jgi:hypothetical protein
MMFRSDMRHWPWWLIKKRPFSRSSYHLVASWSGTYEDDYYVHFDSHRRNRTFSLSGTSKGVGRPTSGMERSVLGTRWGRGGCR